MLLADYHSEISIQFQFQSQSNTIQSNLIHLAFKHLSLYKLTVCDVCNATYISDAFIVEIIVNLLTGSSIRDDADDDALLHLRDHRDAAVWEHCL